MTSTQRGVLQCVLSGDLEGITEHLDREQVSEEGDVCGLKDEAGRTALMTACMLGRRSAIVRELLTHGAPVDQQTVRGYSPLHLAACWGHLDTVRTLVELGADTQTRTFRGDRPVDLARTYSRTDCADCLALAEAKLDLVSYVDSVKALVSDQDQNLTKEEKSLCTRACSAAWDWVQGVHCSTVSDVTARRRDLEEALQPVLSRIHT